MTRYHAHVPRDPLRRARSILTLGFHVYRPPLMRAHRVGGHPGDVRYSQAEWGRRVIVEYLRRVRDGSPAGPYPQEPGS
jgi:hypothetical protein